MMTAAAALISGADALLVDLDGTLVDSTDAVERAWAAFALRHGLDPDHVLHFGHGRPSRETVNLLVPDADHAAETAALERAEIADTDGLTVLPGAVELLRAGTRPLAIVTSCSRALATARLRAVGLPIPSALVTADDVERGKPDPACFLLAARRLAVEPATCVVLEDAPAGISAGRAAGAKVIAVRTTHTDAELDQADVIVDDVAAIVSPASANGA